MCKLIVVFIYVSQVTDAVDCVFLWASWLLVYVVYSKGFVHFKQCIDSVLFISILRYFFDSLIL